MTEETLPEYQRIMLMIRDRIVSGDYPVGTVIPSTTRLVAITGMSRPVVRRAVDQLRAEGVLEGRPGKGVFVRATPQDADRERGDVTAFGDELADVRRRVDGLDDSADDLAARVGRLEAGLIDLYAQLGLDYPHGGANERKHRTTRTPRARAGS